MIKKSILGSALLLASIQLQAQKETTKAVVDPLGKCFGVVGKAQGDCAGKDPASGAVWSCSGQNPTADLGYKELRQSQCKTTAKHQEAKAKKFEAYK